ncbi:hypothetical protein P3339_01780 [Microbulbifer sp. MLAF003]|uniref:hypothetical protein n=1 Tax=Microbulbifer sp. MLAF003 TaxID=3032582 RepID=UPI0024AD03BE|nr:hypothetical protein [Microbulbifer sp. MLAF003]WHI51585.1 hypothetical protein P3339_01780 [Microbulbifer sp. MLAF003]
MKSIRLEKDSDNIVHLIMDNPNASANVMDKDFTDSLQAVVEQLQKQDYKGIIVRSAKKLSLLVATLNLSTLLNETTPKHFLPHVNR